MRLLLLIPLALAVLANSASALMPLGSAAATATPRTAGARPAALTVSLSLDLRCGKPGPAPIVIALPRAWRIPGAVARRAVWINDVHPRSVAVSNHTLTLAPKTPHETCMVIGPGTITVKLTRAAKLGNPRRAGRYTIRASIGTQDFHARVKIKPAG